MFRNITRLKRVIFLNKKINKYEFIYFLLLVFLIFISLFIGFPTDSTNIGISSSNLAIGDRIFYINDSSKGYGYPEYSGNIFYPLVLKIITFTTNIFGKDQYSKLWNFITILISSTLSLISLRLIRKSTVFLFQKKVSEIVCIIYILNPYSYYFSLSGGITNYLIIGVTFLLYLFCRAFKKGYKITKSSFIKDICFINLGCIYLSMLRPNGSIMGILILMFCLYGIISKIIKNETTNSNNIINLFITLFGIVIVTFNIKSSFAYSIDHLSLFSNEGGLFFGYSRDALRNKLSLTSENIFENIKNLFYIFLWKTTDFISGLSDVRDTHSAPNIDQIFPFLTRTFTGIFFLFPVNIFSFFGLISNRNILFRSDIWILIFSCFMAISPSFLGVSMSRYLMMFISPFILFAAKAFHDTFQNGVKT